MNLSRIEAGGNALNREPPSPLGMQIARRGEILSHHVRGENPPPVLRGQPSLLVNLRLHAIGTAVDLYIGHPETTPKAPDFTAVVVSALESTPPFLGAIDLASFGQAADYSAGRQAPDVLHAFAEANRASLILHEPTADFTGLIRMLPEAKELAADFHVPVAEVYRNEMLFGELIHSEYKPTAFARRALDAVSELTTDRIHLSDAHLLYSRLYHSGVAPTDIDQLVHETVTGDRYLADAARNAAEERNKLREGYWTLIGDVWPGELYDVQEDIAAQFKVREPV